MLILATQHCTDAHVVGVEGVNELMATHKILCTLRITFCPLSMQAKSSHCPAYKSFLGLVRCHWQGSHCWDKRSRPVILAACGCDFCSWCLAPAALPCYLGHITYIPSSIEDVQHARRCSAIAHTMH